ncbi:MAG: hypothetical protein IPH57_15020 [Saprospiraceae bacterium]|nr:hypothetical protein [Saprospiraceae bacterium]
MKKNIFILLTLMTFFRFTSLAQELTKAYMKYEITDVKAESEDDPNASMMTNMLKGSITKVYFDGPKSLTKLSMMGGMVNTKIVMDKEGNTEMYMDAMGQKILTKMAKAELDKMKKEEGGKLEYIHHKDKTKEIMGYKAHLVTVKDPSGKNEAGNMQFWVTNEIKTSAVVSQGIDNADIGGFPLEFSISIPGQFSMKTELKELKKDFDASVFEFDKKGYKEMSMEELKNMGMGGF